MQQGATPAPPGKIPNLEDPEDVLHTINLVSQVLAVATVTPIVCFRLYIIKWKNASHYRVDDCMSDPSVWKSAIDSFDLNTDLPKTSGSCLVSLVR